MPKKPRSIALALFLTAALAHAGQQEQLVRTAFDGLRQSSAALDRGDHQRATQILTGLQATASTLRASAESFQKQAKEAEQRAQQQLIDNQNQIDRSIRDENTAQREENEINGALAQLGAERDTLGSRLRQLEKDLEPLRAEASTRQWCNDKWYRQFDPQCLKLGLEDLFAGRWKTLNNQIADVRRQQNELTGKLNGLNRDLAGKQRRLREVVAQKQNLQKQRPALQKKAGVLRDAVVSLTDAATYWADTVVLIQSKMASLETLQDGVRILVKRADNKKQAPVFDSYDKTEISSLENTLLHFARTIDNRTNILLPPK